MCSSRMLTPQELNDAMGFPSGHEAGRDDTRSKGIALTMAMPNMDIAELTKSVQKIIKENGYEGSN